MKKLILVAILLLAASEASAQSTGSQAVPIADVPVTSAATLVKAQNAFRRSLSCTNTHATVHVRWGDSTVTASVGQRIPAGTSIEISIRGPIYMISEGATVTMSCTEELL